VVIMEAIQPHTLFCPSGTNATTDRHSFAPNPTAKESTWRRSKTRNLSSEPWRSPPPACHNVLVLYPNTLQALQAESLHWMFDPHHAVSID